MFLLSLALTPVFVIIIFIYFQDKYSPEPSKLIFGTFLLGVISIIPAVFLELFFESLFYSIDISFIATILYAFIGVGLSEEFCKFLFLRLFIYKNKNFDEPMDGVVYAITLSMGFAAIENILYVFNSNDPYFTAFVRSFTAIPAHASFGAIMGLYFGLSKFTFLHKRSILYLKAIITAALAHGLYDVFLFFGCKICPILTFVSLLIFIIVGLRIISRFKKISPFKKRYLFIHKRTKSHEEIKKLDELKQALIKKFKIR